MIQPASITHHLFVSIWLLYEGFNDENFQIIAINGVSLVGLPLSTCQQYIKVKIPVNKSISILFFKNSVLRLNIGVSFAGLK